MINVVRESEIVNRSKDLDLATQSSGEKEQNNKMFEMNHFQKYKSVT